MIKLPEKSRLPLFKRVLIAILLATLLVGTSFFLITGGLIIGGFSSAGCRVMPAWAPWFILVIWPLAMLASAIAPSILVMMHARWWWVAASIPVGIGFSAFTYALGYLFFVFTC